MKNLAITIITSLISASLGAWLTYYFGIKSKKTEAMLKFKEEKYVKLLIYLQGFLGNMASAELKKRFFEEQYKSWLYSSDEVVRSMNNLVDSVKIGRGENTDRINGRKVVGDIVISMRKDLLGKTKLNYEDFVYTEVIKN